MKISILALTLATVFIQTSWCAPAGASDSDPVAVSTIVPPVPSATPAVSVAAPPPPVRSFTPEEHEEIESELQGMEDRAVLEDMVENGWPREEAEMVLGLFDAVDTMTNDDLADPEEYDTVDELRNSMSQLLSRVGYEYDDARGNIGGASGRKVFSRVMAPASAEAATPPAYSRQSMMDVVRGLTNLVRTASKLGPFLGNPALAHYAKILTSAADMIETVVRHTKNFIAAPRI